MSQVKKKNQYSSQLTKLKNLRTFRTLRTFRRVVGGMGKLCPDYNDTYKRKIKKKGL